MSNRIVSVYDSRNLSETLSTVEINVAPSALIPFYDEDSAVLFLSSKVGIFTELTLRWSYYFIMLPNAKITIIWNSQVYILFYQPLNLEIKVLKQFNFSYDYTVMCRPQ